MDANKYNYYIGTARGSLLFTQEKLNNIKCARIEEPSEVTALAFGQSEENIFVGYQNGFINIYDICENKYIEKIRNLEGEGHIVGIGSLNSNSMVFGKHDGIITIWSGKNNSFFDMSLDEKSTLDILSVNPSRQNIIGTGGEYNDFKLWDVKTHQCIFKAKSLGHDKLNLPIPTSVRGVTFFPKEERLSGCATKEGHVLLYDDRAQRRPVVKFMEPKASYTTICSAYRERQCLVGTTRGYMQLLDMKAGKCLKTFTSFTGSVTSIACDSSEPIVASTSLDRFLRIHNIETKQLLHKVYMKLNLTKLLIKPVVKDEPSEEEVDPEKNLDQEYEDIFSGMETITSDRKLKKQKRKIGEISEKQKKIKKKKRKTNNS